MAKWKQIQKYSSHVPSPLENLNKKRSLTSSVLLLDATPVRILGRKNFISIAYDTALGVVNYKISRTENKKTYRNILKELNGIGYKPICVVSDGNIGLKLLLHEEKYPHQRCVVHLLRDLERLLGKQKGKKLKGNSLCIYNEIRDLWYTKRIEDLPQEIGDYFGKEWLVKWVKKTLPNALLHLSYEENVPNSNNILENFNGQIKQRIKTMRGVKSRVSLYNWLKIFFYFRNYK